MRKSKLRKQLKATLDVGIMAGSGGGPLWSAGALTVISGKRGYLKKPKSKKFKNLGY